MKRTFMTALVTLAVAPSVTAIDFDGYVEN